MLATFYQREPPPPTPHPPKKKKKEKRINCLNSCNINMYGDKLSNESNNDTRLVSGQKPITKTNIFQYHTTFNKPNQ